MIKEEERKVKEERRVQSIIISDDDITKDKILEEYTERCLLLEFLQTINLFTQHNIMFYKVISNYKF